MKSSAGNLKKSNYITLNGDIWQVVKTEHNFRGRGSATLRVKIKNIKTENTLEKTFRPDDTIDLLEMETIKAQYLYKDNEFLYCMDENTFEQLKLNLHTVGSIHQYLKEGDPLQILVYNGKPITLRPPQSVRLKVIEADDAVRGDTVTNTKKTVTLETGVSVGVPLFIKTGDIIVVNPENGEYVERVAK